MAGLGRIVFVLLLLGSVFLENCSASGPATVMYGAEVQKPKTEAGDVGKVVITESGFLRKNKVTEIHYRKSDLSIVSVAVNDKEIPSGRFAEYRDVLLKALEYPRIRDFQARIEAIEKNLKSLGPLDAEKRGKLDALLADLEEFLAQASPSNRMSLDPLVKKLNGVAFQMLVRELLTEKKLLMPGEDVELRMRTSRCEVNGRELPPEVADEVLSLWVKYAGEPIRPNERVRFIFDPER
jgi:hypothetical protein